MMTMRKANFKLLGIVMLTVIAGISNLTAQDSANLQSKKRGLDSNHVLSKSWNKVAFQMKKFNNVVVSYVKTLKKAEPSDSNLTSEVEAYSDSVNAALNHSGEKDSTTLKRLQMHFDSLVQASVRMVKNVEKDSSLKNNKSLKALGKSMNQLREKIVEYQNSFSESLQKKNAKKEEEPVPAKP